MNSLVRHPQELEPQLVACQHAGDIEGMLALYEAEAVVEVEGELFVGREAIRRLFLADIAAGKKYGYGAQQLPVICDDLALTSTRSTHGTVTAEVARRQADGSWCWVIDCFVIAHEEE